MRWLTLIVLALVVACSSSSSPPTRSAIACTSCTWVGRCLVAPTDHQSKLTCCAPITLYGGEPNPEMVRMCEETDRARQELSAREPCKQCIAHRKNGELCFTAAAYGNADFRPCCESEKSLPPMRAEWMCPVD